VNGKTHFRKGAIRTAELAYDVGANLLARTCWLCPMKKEASSLFSHAIVYSNLNVINSKFEENEIL